MHLHHSSPRYLAMRASAVSLCLVALGLLGACDRGKIATTTDDKAAITQPATSNAVASQGRYLLVWRELSPTLQEGEGTPAVPEFETQVLVEQPDGKVTTVGQRQGVALIGSEVGITVISAQTTPTKMCGACNASDPLAACKAAPGEHVSEQDRVSLKVVSPAREVAHAYVDAPSLGQPTAFHAEVMLLSGQVGPYLFAQNELMHMDCMADGERHDVVPFVVDVRTGERVELFDAAALKALASGSLSEEAMARAASEHPESELRAGSAVLRGVQVVQNDIRPLFRYDFKVTCEDCSGMVDDPSEEDVAVIKEEAPALLKGFVEEPGAAVLDALRDASPGARAMGWSHAPRNDATRALVEAGLAQ